MTTKLLIDSMPIGSGTGQTWTLEESKSGKGKVIARGEFARSDRPTENKRLYPKELWIREAEKLSESMKSRGVFGEADHPGDGRTKLVRVSHVLTGLKVVGDQVIGEAEILDTPNGRILKAIMEAGCKVGVSSRGFGSTKSVGNGIEEVQEDFSLDTFDFVADPATKTAYPEIFAEERARIAEDGMLTIEELRKNYPGLIAEVKAAVLKEETDDVARAMVLSEERVTSRLKETFADQLLRATEQIREDAMKAARSELLSDPSVAKAKTIVERIAMLVSPFGGGSPAAAEQVQAKDDEISRLKTELANRIASALTGDGGKKFGALRCVTPSLLLPVDRVTRLSKVSRAHTASTRRRAAASAWTAGTRSRRTTRS